MLSNLNSMLLKLISEDKVICFNLGWGDKAIKGNDSEGEGEEEEKNLREPEKPKAEDGKKNISEIKQIEVKH